MNNFALRYSEAPVHRFSSKLAFLKILQYSPENTCISLESLLKKVADLKGRNLIRKRLEHLCFPVIIITFLRTAFL